MSKTYKFDPKDSDEKAKTKEELRREMKRREEERKRKKEESDLEKELLKAFHP